MREKLKGLVLKWVMEGSDRSLMGMNREQGWRRCQGLLFCHGKGKYFRLNKISNPGSSGQ